MQKTIRTFASVLLLTIMTTIPCRGTVLASAEVLPAVQQLLVMPNAILVLREDGTVVPIPLEMNEHFDYHYVLSEQNMREISEWKDIKELARCFYLIIGLKADGTVEATSLVDGSRYLERVSSWKDVKKLVSGYCYAAGIREDGSVVTVGEIPEVEREEDGWLDCLEDWTDIVKLEIGVTPAGEYVAGLRSDGTMEYQGIYDAGWTGPSDHIADFSCSGWMLIAVREDGSVTANGEHSGRAAVILDWKDMKQVGCADSEAIGLRKDGTILVMSESRAELLNLTDVNRIEFKSLLPFVAYRSDGSIWIEPSEAWPWVSEEMLKETEKWIGVEQVLFSMYDTKTPFILGLKRDGTVSSAGIDFEALYREALG